MIQTKRITRITQSLAAVSILAICFAFAPKPIEGLENTFGVSANDPSQIELRLSKDFKFSYQDFSNSTFKINVQGSYTLKGNKIALTTEQDDVRFHDTWKLTNNGGAVTARRGLSFYTLQELK